MARGSTNRGRGGPRGTSNGQSFGGRGGWSPRGERGGRGGRGGRARGRGFGRGGFIPLDDFDLPIQQWPSSESFRAVIAVRI